MSELTILIDSDLHFDENGIRGDKVGNVDKIKQECVSGNIDVLICAGDLTKYGTDGKCCTGGTDEAGTFIREYVKELDPTIKPRLCMGNHDNYVPWPYIHKPIRNFIFFRHGGLRYNFDIKGYKFICLNVYPDDRSLRYLRRVLSNIGDQPVILFWHYNLTGPLSDWWPKTQKDKLYNLLQETGANVKLIITGHTHTNRLITWKNYKTVLGSGARLVKCELSGDDVKFTKL